MIGLEREVGKLEARMETVEQELQALRVDVREIRDALVRARGGWLLLTGAMTAATAAGAGLAKILPLFLQGRT